MIARLAVLCVAVALGQAGAGELTRRFERTLERALEGGLPATRRSSYWRI
ncbi:MAG: hypothetical protein R2748_16885 [Bryobacterales bacterium]